MYNYHDIFFYYAFGALNGGGGSIQVIGITEGTTSVTFESNGKPLITYRIYGSSSGVGDLNAETGKYDITVTCNEDTYTISLDAPLMDGEYIDYKTQRLYPSGLDVSMPEISTIEGTNTLTVITTNPSSKVYVECYRAKDIPLPVASTIIGSVPFEFQCYEAGNLMDYSISGNAIQDGMPSPDAPVDATGCGVRTGNLAPPLSEWVDGYITGGADGGFLHAQTEAKEKTSDFIEVSPSTAYTFSFETGNFIGGTSAWRAIAEYNERKEYIGRPSGGTTSPQTITTSLSTKYLRLMHRTYGSSLNTMLNLGSTALPYEPYGYKLPLTVNGTEYPIFLGQVETTRRVKKLVLTGEETWQLWNGNYYSSVIDRKGAISTILCTHFINSSVKGISYNGQSTSGLKIARVAVPFVSSVNDLKAWLAAQYANGTPVTVWYVLAEPETAIVNEPLLKIGDYADTINLSQTGIDIPVIKGNNVLTINTDVPPSETYIKYNGKEKEYGYYITSDGYIYTASDGYKYGIRS